MNNFWTQLENQQLANKEATEKYLLTKLGSPKTEIQTNLYGEILKKIVSYYFTSEEPQNYTTYSLFGSITEISERRYKEGKNKGQVYYVLKLGGGNTKETLQARKENLTEDKWNQISHMKILGQNLVFKYRKWITNKQVLDFYPQGTSGTEMLTGWLSVRYHLPSGVRINPDFSVSKSFPRWPCWPLCIREKF